MIANRIGLCHTMIQFHPVLIQFIYRDPNYPLERYTQVIQDTMVDQDNLPYITVEDPNSIIQDQIKRSNGHTYKWQIFSTL